MRNPMFKFNNFFHLGFCDITGSNSIVQEHFSNVKLPLIMCFRRNAISFKEKHVVISGSGA